MWIKLSNQRNYIEHDESMAQVQYVLAVILGIALERSEKYKANNN